MTIDNMRAEILELAARASHVRRLAPHVKADCERELWVRHADTLTRELASRRACLRRWLRLHRARDGRLAASPCTTDQTAISVEPEPGFADQAS